MNSLNLEYLFYVIYHWFRADWWAQWFGGDWLNLRLASLIFTAFFLIIIVRLAREVVRLRHNEGKELTKLLEVARAKATPARNEKWERVLGHLNSPNPNDWKSAILEADAMLDELVKTFQLPGESLGERLKAVEASDFTTIDRAWSAHRLRNRIAHEPTLNLTEREVREAIGHYRAVFEEFKLI